MYIIVDKIDKNTDFLHIFHVDLLNMPSILIHFNLILILPYMFDKVIKVPKQSKF